MKKLRSCERKKGIAHMQYFLSIAWDLNPNENMAIHNTIGTLTLL